MLYLREYPAALYGNVEMQLRNSQQRGVCLCVFVFHWIMFGYTQQTLTVSEQSRVCDVMTF